MSFGRSMGRLHGGPHSINLVPHVQQSSFGVGPHGPTSSGGTPSAGSTDRFIDLVRIAATPGRTTAGGRGIEAHMTALLEWRRFDQRYP